jgi:LacI family transcriptional regulator
MKYPTQEDVARRVGVSRATVSYVLSGRESGPISVTEETRQRIIQAAEEVGYVPDASAQSLRRGATHMIGFTLPDMNNPHMWQIVRGADLTARAVGYDLLLISTVQDYQLEKSALLELSRRRIDGLVLAQAHINQLNMDIRVLANQQRPVTVLGDYDDNIHDLDTVTPGHREGAVQLMAHLIQLGHCCIGFVFGVAREPLGKERLTSYMQALRQAGITPDPQLVINCGITIEDGYQAALRILDSKPMPTAILVINDLLAIGVMRAIADKGLRVPEDISVAGFDDIDMASFLTPALTTVRVFGDDIGITAVNLILERLKEPDRPAQHIHLPAQLVLRASTGPAPARITAG